MYPTINRFLQFLIFIIFKPVLWYFLDVKIEGLEKIQNEEPYVLASNHQSELDPIIILAVFYAKLKRKPLYYASREKKFYDASGWRGIFYGGLFFKLIGAFPVYPKMGDYKIALFNHIKFLRDGRSVCIFPEGIRSHDGKLGKGKGGVLFLSQETGAPIIPVAITGVLNLTFTEFIFKKRKVVVRIGNPIDTKKYLTKYDSKDYNYYNENAQLVMNQIQTLL